MSQPTRFALTSRILLLGIPLLMGPQCPGEAVDDDATADDDDAASALCSGPGCVNSGSCPATEPADGDTCGFTGNCHYCVGGDDAAANGYTCDMYYFSAQGTFNCTE